MFVTRAVSWYDLTYANVCGNRNKGKTEDGYEELDGWEWQDWLGLALCEQFLSLWI